MYFLDCMLSVSHSLWLSVFVGLGIPSFGNYILHRSCDLPVDSLQLAIFYYWSHLRFTLISNTIFWLLIFKSYHILFQVLRVSNYDSDAEISEIPWALARPTSKPDLRRNVNPKYRVDELNEPPPRFPGIRSLLPLPGGDLLTGGTDLKIRRWDHYRFCVGLYSWLPFLPVRILMLNL